MLRQGRAGDLLAQSFFSWSISKKSVEVGSPCSLPSCYWFAALCTFFAFTWTLKVTCLDACSAADDIALLIKQTLLHGRGTMGRERERERELLRRNERKVTSSARFPETPSSAANPHTAVQRKNKSPRTADRQPGRHEWGVQINYLSIDPRRTNKCRFCFVTSARRSGKGEEESYSNYIRLSDDASRRSGQ